MSGTKRKIESNDDSQEPQKKKQKIRKYNDYSSLPTTKYCNRCEQTLVATDFAIRKLGSGTLILQTNCIICSRKIGIERDAKSKILRESLRQDQVIENVNEPKKKKQRTDRKYIDYTAFPPTKCCNYCKKMLPSTDFIIRLHSRTKKPMLVPDCTMCTHIKDQERHEKDCEFRKNLIRQQGKCGTCHKVTEKMEFAHYERSSKGSNQFCNMRIPAMIKELPKGRFLCFLCHSKETYLENTTDISMSPRAISIRKQRQKRHDYVNKRKLKEFKECKDCKFAVADKIVRFFEFDHLDSKLKVDCVSVLISNCRPFSEIDAEIAKCELVCRDCHYDRTMKREHWKPKPVKTTEIDLPGSNDVSTNSNQNQETIDSFLLITKNATGTVDEQKTTRLSILKLISQYL